MSKDDNTLNPGFEANAGAGGAMTVMQEMWRLHQTQAGLDRMRYAMTNDGRTQGMADLASRMLTGGSLAQLQASNPGMAGLMTNLSAAFNGLGLYGGGSPASMMDSIYGGVSRGGFQMRGANPMMAQTLRGPGSLTDQISRQMFDSVQGQFFAPSGAAYQNRTQGLNRSELGDVFSMMSQQGSFAGLAAGRLETMDLGGMRRLAEKARKAGDAATLERLGDMSYTGLSAEGIPTFEVTNIPEGTIQTVSRKMQDMAKTLGGLRDLFQGASMREVAREAERLSGVNLSAPGGVQEAGRRLESARLTARAYGIDERRFLETIAAGSQMSDLSRMWGADPMATRGLDMTISGLSARMGVQGFDQNQLMRAHLAGRGIFAPERSMESMIGRQTQIASRFIGQERTAMAAMAAFDISGITGDDRAALEQMVGELGSATTMDERRAIRARINEHTQRVTGLDPTQLRKNMSEGELVAALSSGSQNTLATMGVDAAQSNLVNALARTQSQMGLSGNANENLFGFFSTFGDSQGAVIDALKSGGITGLRDMLNAEGGPGAFLSPAEREKFVAQMAALETQGGSRSAADILTQASGLINVDGQLADIPLSSKEGKLNMARERGNTWIRENRLGSDKSSLGLVDLFVEGMLGGGAVPTAALFRYAEEQGKDISRFGLHEDGGLAFRGMADFEKMQKAIKASGGTDLAAMMGVGSSKEAILKLTTSEGLMQLQEQMGKLGMVGSFLEDGSYGVMGKGAAENDLAELNQAMTLQMISALPGADRAKTDSAIKNVVKANLGKLAIFATDDRPDDAGELFRAYVNREADMAPLLGEEAERLYTAAEKESDQSKKATMIGQADALRKLHEDMKTGAGQYKGTMSVTVTGKGTLEIFEASAGDSVKIGHQ